MSGPGDYAVQFTTNFQRRWRPGILVIPRTRPPATLILAMVGKASRPPVRTWRGLVSKFSILGLRIQAR